ASRSCGDPVLSGPRRRATGPDPQRCRQRRAPARALSGPSDATVRISWLSTMYRLEAPKTVVRSDPRGAPPVGQGADGVLGSAGRCPDAEASAWMCALSF